MLSISNIPLTTKGDIAAAGMGLVGGFAVDVLLFPAGIPPGTIASLSAVGAVTAKNAVQAVWESWYAPKELELEQEEAAANRARLMARAQALTGRLEREGLNDHVDSLQEEMGLWEDEIIDDTDFEQSLDESIARYRRAKALTANDHEGIKALTGGTSLKIVSVTPPNDVEDVEPNKAVTATFSNDLDPASIKGTDHFTLVRVDTERTAYTPVVGDVDYGPPTYPPRVAGFIPAYALEMGRTYHATVTQGVRDQKGNTLPEGYTWQFKVAS